MSRDFKPLRSPNRTVAAQVQESIREAILGNTLTPGSRIDQNKLADDLNVSLVPIREALKGLEAEGLVTIIPRRGAFVTEISREHLDDLYFARQLIEGEVIFHTVPLLQSDHFAQLHDLIEQMKACTEAEDFKQFMTLNRRFHLTIYEVLGNQHLLETISSLWERSELYRYRYVLVLHNSENVHREHEGILQACKANDPALAKQLAAQHIHHTQQWIHEELAAAQSQDEH